MKGLLIVDMQKGGFKPETPRYEAAGVLEFKKLLEELGGFQKK